MVKAVSLMGKFESVSKNALKIWEEIYLSAFGKRWNDVNSLSDFTFRVWMFKKTEQDEHLFKCICYQKANSSSQLESWCNKH